MLLNRKVIFNVKVPTVYSLYKAIKFTLVVVVRLTDELPKLFSGFESEMAFASCLGN